MDFLIAFILYWALFGIAEADQGNEILLHQNKASQLIKLTDREKSWLATHKKITIAFDGSLPPYSFIKEAGHFEGMAVDIINAIAKNLNVKFQTYPDPNWNNIYKAAVAKKIDVVATMIDRPDRHLWFNFTQPYLTKSLVIMVRNNNQSIKIRTDLQNKKVALVKGYSFNEHLKKEFSIKPYYVDTMLEGLRAVSRGKVDALITFMATANYLQSKYGIKNVKFADFYERNSANESIAVRKDWPILTEILKKGLDSLTDAEINAIFTKWAPLPPSEPKPSTGSEDTDPQTALQSAESSAAGVRKKITFDLNWEVPTPIWLLIIVLLLWILQIKRQFEALKNSRNELRTVNAELQELQNNLEQMVIKRTAQLKASELKFRNLVENQGNEFFFYHHDNAGNFTYLGPAMTNILGYSTNDFKANFRDYLTDNPVNQKAEENIKMCMEGVPTKPYQIEIFDINKKIRWLEVIDSPVYDDYGNCIGVDGVMLDITARKLADENMIYLSYYDSLTKLANRRLFMDRLQQFINLANRKQQQFALFLLDIVNFTDINDTIGRSVGDEILIETAGRLIAALRNSDIKARFGGDEFALLLPETNKEQAYLVAQKIIKVLKEPYLLSGKKLNLNISIGIANFPQDGQDCNALIKQADTAMSYAINKRLEVASSVNVG